MLEEANVRINEDLSNRETFEYVGHNLAGKRNTDDISKRLW